MRVLRIQAPHCPSCGAPLPVPEGAARVTCAYCNAPLVIEAERISTRHPQRAQTQTHEDDEAPYPEPDATLWAKVSPRFELSVIEQRVPQAVPERFAGLELASERFAFVALRVVDRDGRPVAHQLDEAFAALKSSLEEDGDPGLAANLALEALCATPFDHRLECTVVLFEPRHMKVTAYLAGTGHSVLWASSEEGRSISLDGHHPALERKMLRETADHFSNSRAVQLAAADLVLIPSAGFMGRGMRGHSDGARVLLEVANAQLGEAPLRVVTLAKNGFWAEFQKQRRATPSPVGDVRVAAVRAVPPPAVTALPATCELKTFRTRRYEVTCFARAGDALTLRPLERDRHALVWLSGAPAPDEVERALGAVTTLLDGEHGDNENPRRAGRDALAAMGPAAAPDRRAAVVQLFDEHERVKYWRHGWKQPLALGPRGLKGDSLQQFDDGGEASVHEGSRLFFPGALTYDGQFAQGAAFAVAWPGGKASRLYAALAAHWKTKKTERALTQLALAALSDEPGADLCGLMLVTCLPP